MADPVYVQRDETGAIVGRFANLQPGLAEERLADDTPELKLLDGRAAKSAVAAAYFAALSELPAGFKSGGKLYQVDDASQARITSLGALALASLNASAVPWPQGFAFIAADNTPVPMTAVQMIVLGAEIAGYVIGCRLRYRAIKTALAAAADAAALDAIDVTADYPPAHD